MGIVVVKEASVEAWLKRVEAKIPEVLIYGAIEGLNEARLKGSYTDRTGNLRSSIGYVVFNGSFEVQEAGFLPTSGSEGGAKGQTDGKAYLNQIKAQYNDADYTLIMVAGMEYSGYVEANYDVLASAEIKSKDSVAKMFNLINWNEL